MNWSQGGDFTKSLLSLQLQLQTLLEGVGGEDSAGLLDALAKLSDTERAVVIPALTKSVLRVLSGEKRLQSQSDLAMEDFENELFESVLSAMGDAGGETPSPTREASKKLAVVPGGKVDSDVVKFKKPVRISSPIDLSKARENRKKNSLTYRDRDLM
jgi:hypothetical protein